MSLHTRVLVVDADGPRAHALAGLLAPAGYDTIHCARARDAAGASADVVLLSVDVVDTSDVTRVAALLPDADIVLLVDARLLGDARAAVRVGACDAIDRGAGAEPMLHAVERAAREGRGRRELAMLRARVGDEARRALVGQSSSMTAVRDLIGRAAGTRRTVLVTGESGTGKSTVARLVHELSDRAARPFVVARCDRSTAGALEAELFGADRGGLLESARGGTLVLDEVRAVPRGMRARLALLAAERVVRRAGAAGGAPVDVRFVLTARTDEDAAALEPDDLAGDVNVLPIALPPLRERRSDIPLLVQHFRERLSLERGNPLPALGPETMTPLLGHQWPGNVRELEHWLDRISLSGPAGNGTPDRGVTAPGLGLAGLDTARLTLHALEQRYILHVLAQEGGHQSRAADRLGIDRRTLYRKLKEYRDSDGSLRVAG
jgi:two-component system response regulator HydG